MEKLFVLLLFCHVSSSVKHSLKIFGTANAGVPNFPEFMSFGMVDGAVTGYCDSNRRMPEPKHEWVKKIFESDPQQLEWYTQQCSYMAPNFLKATISTLKQRFNQSGGVHILQMMFASEWDDETGELHGFYQYGYDGEDLMALDLKTLTWITPKQQVFTTKLTWDADGFQLQGAKKILTEIFPKWLKTDVAIGKSYLLRTELPSVSLLQKTPSSPVSCYATGFYPDRAALFWRKDGEELHEDVEHREVLPNHDGTFQMSVDLNISSVRPEDWRRHDCVFHLSGVNDDIIIRLDKDVLKTNWEKPGNLTVPITAAVVVVALILIAATGFIIYKKKKANRPPSSPGNSSELSEELNPEK